MKKSAFTLMELLVAIAITSLLVVLLAKMGESAGSAWKRGAAQAESYSTARGAISIIGRELEGAVIDLDIGFHVDEVTEHPGTYVLKFLRRRDPDDAGSVEKTAYQLAWASRGLLPTVKAAYDAEHPVPVLIRTTSSDLTDVYEIASSSHADAWAKNWGTLKEGDTVQTGQPGGTDGVTITEIAAEYILSWDVIPKFWQGSRIQSDDKDNPFYYGRYLTSDRAPSALEIRLAVVPSQSFPQLSSFGAEWSALRDRDDLFDAAALGDGPFDNLLRKNLKNFSTTFYLSSRTP